MDVREKMVELIKEGIRKGLRTKGDDRLDYSFEDVADYLISNGVTVQENVKMSDELLKQLKNAPITICKEEPSIVTVQKWISVKDRLPRNYTPVLAYIPSLAQTMQQTVHECHIGADGEWHSSAAPAYREGVTHWMPLPEPPEVGRND